MRQKKQTQASARNRAEIIMKVRCGLMTATDAAKVLGVSRKTYYKWEQRGLAALLGGLQDQSAGRKEKPELARREEELEKQLGQVKREKEILQKKMALREITHQLASAKRSKKK